MVGTDGIIEWQDQMTEPDGGAGFGTEKIWNYLQINGNLQRHLLGRDWRNSLLMRISLKEWTFPTTG